jgi:GNAT superfamily N-acetyltransferase
MGAAALPWECPPAPPGIRGRCSLRLVTKTGAQTSVTKISVVNIDVVRNYQETLLRDHWSEVAKNKGLMVLDPDWDTYYQLEEKGLLVTLVAWSAVGANAGGVVGYSVNILQKKHLHYRGLTMFQNDVLYVAKEARGRSIGARLIKATVQKGKELGAKLMLWHAKETNGDGSPSELGPLLLKMGYGVQDIIYSTEI